ncbi:MAG: M48 family metallopeptidase [Candidatus Binatia bacterium]
MECSAVVHNPVTRIARRGTITWNSTDNGGELHVKDVTGVDQRIASTALSLARGGWRGDAIHLSWEYEDRIWAVTVDEPDAIAELAQALPAEFARQVAQWRTETKRGQQRTAIVFTALALLAFLPIVGLISLYAMRDRILDAVVVRLPTSVDTRLGELMYQQIAASGTLVREGPAVDAVRMIGQQLIAEQSQPFTFRFEVLNDPSVNAFAAPGGVVVVHTGLLAEVPSADQLVGVLAHEVTHVTRRHSLRQLVYELGLTTTVRWIFGAPDGVADTIATVALNLSTLRFSRAQETEADQGAVKLLRRARLPATGLQSFFTDPTREHGNLPAWLSTHPSDADRAAALTQLLTEQGTWEIEPLPLDWESVRNDAKSHLVQSAP